MTQDVIALTPDMPGRAALIAALHAGGPGLALAASDDGAVLRLCTSGGRPLVAVEAPLLVHTPGEAERLLGSGVAVSPLPYWWTEIRASTAAPEAGVLARSIGGRLTTLLGGEVWPPGEATTRTVALSADEERVNAEILNTAASPDVLTDSTAVLLSDRPVVALTASLTEVLRETAASGRALHLVTPPHARMTLPLRTALGGAPDRWVVRDPEGGYFDGLSGAELVWRDGTFAPSGPPVKVAAAFAAGTASGEERRLTLTFRTVHAPTADLVLGGALEAVWYRLTGGPPVGWGTAEPANLPWSPRQLTDLARDRAPAPTHLVVVGAPEDRALATLRVSRTTAGVAQEVTLTFGCAHAAEVPLDAVESVAETLAEEHGLTTMLTTLSATGAAPEVFPRFEEPPVPVSFTLGPRDVKTAGLAHASHPPVAWSPRRLGPPAAPALHYALGAGTAAAWADLRALTAHLSRGGRGLPEPGRA